MTNILINIFDFIISIPSLIWELFKLGFETIINLLTNVWEFFSNFFVNLFNFIKDIFVPGEKYFENKFNSLKDVFLGKFKFIGQLNDIFDYLKTRSISESYEDLRITFPKYNIDIDFSWYEPYRVKFRNILIGAFSLIFVAGIVRRNDPKINMGGN